MHLVDEGAAARVGAGGGRVPESATEGDVAEIVGVNVRVRVRVSARAVVGERREVVAANLREVAQDGAVARAGVSAEPGRVARRRRGVVVEVATGRTGKR